MLRNTRIQTTWDYNPVPWGQLSYLMELQQVVLSMAWYPFVLKRALSPLTISLNSANCWSLFSLVIPHFMLAPSDRTFPASSPQLSRLPFLLTLFQLILDFLQIPFSLWFAFHNSCKVFTPSSADTSNTYNAPLMFTEGSHFDAAKPSTIHVAPSY